MQMKRFTLEFHAALEVDVYAPVDATQEQIQRIAAKVSRDLERHGWEPPEFEASVSAPDDVDVSDADRELGPPNRSGFRKLVRKSSPLAGQDVVVLNDDGDNLVVVEDATWWRAGS